MEKVSKPNRHQKFGDNGRRKVGMPMDGASVRDIDRIRRKREESSKKGAKGRKRNRYKV
jgi:hypothetical protein